LRQARGFPHAIGHQRDEARAERRRHSQHLVEVRLVQPEQARRAPRPPRSRVGAHAGERKHAGQRAPALRDRRHQLPADREEDLHRSLEHDDHILGRLAALEDRLSRAVLRQLAVRRQPRQLLRRQLREGRHRFQLVDADAAHIITSST
jgi:hypothetical protein